MIEMKYYDSMGVDVTSQFEDLKAKLAVAEQVIETLNEKLKLQHTPKKPKRSD